MTSAAFAATTHTEDEGFDRAPRRRVRCTRWLTTRFARWRIDRGRGRGPHELLRRVVGGVDLGDRPQLGVRAEDEVDRGGGPPDVVGRRGRGRRRRSPSTSDAFHSVPMSSRLTKKSLVSVPGPVGEDAGRRAAGVGAQRAQATDQHGHLRSGQRQQVGAVEQQRLRRELLARRAGSCGSRPPAARAPRTTRRRSAPARRRCGPGVNGTVTSWPASFAAFSTAAPAGQHDQVGQRDLRARAG